LKSSLTVTGTDKQFHSSLHLCNLYLSYNVFLERVMAMTTCKFASALHLLHVCVIFER